MTKKRRRRTSLITKAINIGVLLLGISRPLELALAGNTRQILVEASAGLVSGGFDRNAALRFYGPFGAAIILKKAISMLRRTTRV